MKKRPFLCLAVLGGLLLTVDTVFGQQTPMGGSVDQKTAAPAPALSAPLIKRYTIPFFWSVTGTTRSATDIIVGNASGRECDINVQWFKGLLTTPECSITLTVAPGTLGAFCSRAIDSSVFQCLATCSPALTNDGGKAVVSSSNLLGCQNIMVDAQVTYTSDLADAAVLAQRQLTVVKGLLSKGQ